MVLVFLLVLYSLGCFPSLSEDFDEIAVENLATYFESLDPRLRLKCIEEEMRYRQKYGIYKLSDWEMMQLEIAQ
jgi:hypothetical protein